MTTKLAAYLGVMRQAVNQACRHREGVVERYVGANNKIVNRLRSYPCYGPGQPVYGPGQPAAPSSFSPGAWSRPRIPRSVPDAR
jgi:hypothetical protein